MATVVPPVGGEADTLGAPWFCETPSPSPPILFNDSFLFPVGVRPGRTGVYCTESLDDEEALPTQPLPERPVLLSRTRGPETEVKTSLRGSSSLWVTFEYFRPPTTTGHWVDG